MPLFIELEPTQIVASLIGIDWVQRGVLGQSMVVTYSSGAGSHVITYASTALAIEAVNDWLEAANAPPEPAGGLKPGDACLVSHHTHARGALGEQVAGTLLAFPTPEFPFWVIEIDNAIIYVDNVTVSKPT